MGESDDYEDDLGSNADADVHSDDETYYFQGRKPPLRFLQRRREPAQIQKADNPGWSSYNSDYTSRKVAAARQPDRGGYTPRCQVRFPDKRRDGQLQRYDPYHKRQPDDRRRHEGPPRDLRDDYDRRRRDQSGDSYAHRRRDRHDDSYDRCRRDDTPRSHRGRRSHDQDRAPRPSRSQTRRQLSWTSTSETLLLLTCARCCSSSTSGAGPRRIAPP